jgi:hypothetical protein
MDTNHIAFELGRAGILPAALEDGLRRAEHYFQEHASTPEDVTTWCQSQRQAAPHLFGVTPSERLNMSREQFDRMPVDWRLAQAYQDPGHVVDDRQARRQAAVKARDAARQQGQG